MYLQNRYIEACELGNIFILKELITECNNIVKLLENVNFKYGETPLHIACVRGHYLVVNMMIGKGANLNIKNINGVTPLHAAMNFGHADIAKLLILNGADINIKTANGWSPLHTASYNGHIGIVELLLEKGYNINTLTNDGWTPLYTAIQANHDEVVKCLIGMGADINLQYKRGNLFYTTKTEKIYTSAVITKYLLNASALIEQKNILLKQKKKKIKLTKKLFEKRLLTCCLHIKKPMQISKILKMQRI